jgi:hypothetical protein
MNGLTIGLVAYQVNPSMVFVRVPTERGRYLLTDRCVVEVPCGHCGAMVGEPCRRGTWWRHVRQPEWIAAGPPKHGVGVHVCRRDDGRRFRGGNVRPGDDPPKVRIAAEDFIAAQGEPETTAVIQAIDNLISKVRVEACLATYDRTALARAQLLEILGLSEPPVDIDFDVERTR